MVQAAVRTFMVGLLLLSLDGCSGCGGGGASGAPSGPEHFDASAGEGDAASELGGGDGVAGDGSQDEDAGQARRDAGHEPAMDAGHDAGAVRDAGRLDAGPKDAGRDADVDADVIIDESSYEDDEDEDGPDEEVDAGGDAGPCVDGVLIDGVVNPSVKVLINEIVITPRRDWGHTESKRHRFDGSYEYGKIDTSDQYVELYNAGSVPVDMRDWTLEVHDSASSRTVIGKGTKNGQVYTFSAGSSLSSFKPGAYMLVGNPAGYSSSDAFYLLHSPCGALLDDVEVGGNTSSRDSERDGLGDGAPAAGENGRSRGVFDEALARVPDHLDTDHDIGDFAAMRATPLAVNVFDGFDPSDHAAPSVTLTPAGETSFAVSGAIRVSFYEALDGWSTVGSTWNSASPAIVLSSGGVALPLAAPELEDGDRTLIVNPIGVLPFDADVQVSLSQNGHSLRDLSGNAMVPVQFSFHTEPAPAPNPPIVLNEIVCDPRQDWGGGQFSGVPAHDFVSSEDEWIELVNRHAGTTDLSRHVIVIFNGPNATTSTRSVFTLADAEASASSRVRVFGAGLSASVARQGDYVVIGNPPGSISVNVWVELREPSGKPVEDGSGRLLDSVEIGGNSSAEDRGGDGARNGAPAAGRDGSSDDLTNESVARLPDGADSNDDIADFCRSSASLGAANAGVCQSGT